VEHPVQARCGELRLGFAWVVERCRGSCRRAGRTCV